MQELLVSGSLGGLVPWLKDSLPAIVAILAAISIIALFRRRTATTSGQGIGSKIGAALLSAVTTNWQLSLLATAAALLSFASGWRTWDGMKNFTGEPVASLLMTFGIQAVMLIIAWLIGESFAAGLRTRHTSGDGKRGFWNTLEPAVGGIVGALCAVTLMAAIANAFGAFDGIMPSGRAKSGWLEFADKALYAGVGLLILATLLINHRSDVVQPYVQSARLIAKNAMLWVMFLLCMATGVFFSFDSFFNSIFPASERSRAAEIRSQRQVAGVVNDIGVLATRRQTEESEALFRSPGWAAYEKNLAGLARASQGVEQEIERYFVERMEAHKSAMAAQQERIATARSGQAGLTSRKAVLMDELSRLKGERPALAAELAEKKTELDNRAKGLDAKRVEMMAEERGAEGTLKVGQGPVYRQRKGELQQLQDAFKIQEERVRDAQKRQQAVDTRIAQIEREVAAVDGDLAKLRGEADTAAQRIAAAEQAKAGDSGDVPKLDPARVRSAFERSLADFRQEPTVEHLNQLAAQCTQLLTAMSAAPATKDRVRDLDCDPKPAAEASARVFALNAGLSTFAQNCSGGAKLPTTGGTDALLAFGRKCLQDSGLPTADSNDMAAKISAIDLNRDDKAHRFVVTWNAFLDGNRLAYLSLAIAVALDSLIFMSGLFGANAVRSPLTEVEHDSEMSADQLDAVIDATLAETIDARAVLSAMLGALHPVRNVDGFSSEIILDEREPLVDEMRKVLNAGSNISAVRPVGGDRNRYLVHSGLIRYLTLAQRKPWKVNTAAVNQRQLVNVIGVALLPDPQGNAEIVLSEMHPISDAEGFAAETSPFKIVDQGKNRLVMNTLGAGATVPGAVKRNNDDGRYFVSTDFYKTLLMMRAAAIPAYAPDAVQRRFGPTAGGALRSEPLQALEGPAMRQIEDQRQADRGAPGNGHAQPGSLSASAQPPRPNDALAMPPAAASVMPPPEKMSPHMAEAQRAAAQPPPPKPHASPLASEIRAAIINHGLHPWTDQEIEAAWRSSATRGLEQAVWDLIERRSRLGNQLEAAIQELQETVDEAYHHLRDDHSTDRNYIQVLESEVQKLKHLVPVLVMTPSGPYEQTVEKMIRNLRTRGGILEDQVGNGRLTAEELALLRALEKHLYQLRQLAGNAIDRGDRLAAILDAYQEGTAADVWTGRGDPSPLT
jgi:hypothetical protein